MTSAAARARGASRGSSTYARLTREIHQVALKYHPHVEVHMVGWWWTEEEHRLLADWTDRSRPAG